MEEKYWKQFENSGRIEDYLSFVNSTGRERCVFRWRSSVYGWHGCQG